ncbi:hypothetical protein EXIGLDRAFT_841510 [Exidia glandulosa HHB12029]|uniref:Uncharacterized protein n=1 Tax=Exidia glandulosa HHB12029 TaxID=1314781 RepID=A0A165DUE5_EXIGL|nr:hypothetical protein EXIGLDRAFT_841510 [Exidia glandulosa HHB12029]
MLASATPSSSSFPPAYPLPPTYTLDARPDERVLSRTTRRTRAARHEPRAQLTTKGAAYFVALRGARQVRCRDVDLPSYGRGDVVDGSVTLTTTKRVTNISVTVEGRMKCTFGEGLADTFTFLSNSYTLWDASLPSEPLHEAHDFSIPLPATFDDNGAIRALPASYAFQQGDFRTSVDYRLVVRVTARKAYLPKLTQTRRLIVPIAYKPRLRPPRAPLSQTSTLLETIKVAPDEWSNIALPTTSSLLQAEVAFPASRIFSAGQTVPLHFQLSGDAHTLASFSASYTTAPTKSSAPHDSHSHPHPHQMQCTYGLPSYDSCIASTSGTASSSASSLASTSSLGITSQHSCASSATLVSHSDIPAIMKHSGKASSSSQHITALLERRIALIGPLGPTWRTQVLATASLHLSSPLALEDGTITLDGTLVVPDDSHAALGPAYRVGALAIVDSLVFAVEMCGREKRVPVVLVSEGFFGDEEEDVEMEL